jgi:dihydroorotate dehydrogenase
MKLDLYPLLRPLLFSLDAELAHHLGINAVKHGLSPYYENNTIPSLHTNICGLNFPNPVGLAAGLDKQAEAITGMFGFGFGSIELGSITPHPQPGNPKPRLFRIEKAEAIINRFGFNSDGFEVCRSRIAAYRTKNTNKPPQGILGINIGKNKDSTDATPDYTAGISTFAPYADYLTINISSPNTPGLRDLQGREAMNSLLHQVMSARNNATRKPPVFVKIAPDLDESQMHDIAETALFSGIDGLIIGNTTLTRPGNIPPQLANKAGGLSGKPLFELSTKILARMYRLTNGKIPLIGCGGIASGTDAYTKICAGASLVQLYSALIYQGPSLIPRINRELATLLERDGFTSVAQAVGSSL